MCDRTLQGHSHLLLSIVHPYGVLRTGLSPLLAHSQHPNIFVPLVPCACSFVSPSPSQLFDVRAYDKGPFFTFAPDLGEQSAISGISFSNDGKLMLVSTPRGMHALLDAFNGGLLGSFVVEQKGEGGVALDACFSGSADYVLAGASDGAIWHWPTSGGQAAPTLPSTYCGAVRALKCNPTRVMVASACANGFITLLLPRR